MTRLTLIVAVALFLAPNSGKAQSEMHPGALLTFCNPKVENRVEFKATCDNYIAGVLDMANSIGPIVQQGICIPSENFRG